MAKKRVGQVENHPVGPVDEHSLERVPGQEFAAEPVAEEDINTTPQRAVPYAPVPMAFHISQSKLAEDEMLVSLSIQTPEGDKVFFLDPETGKQLGEALIKMGEASANGVVYSD